MTTSLTPRPETASAISPTSPTLGSDGFLAMFQTMGLSAERLHALADMLVNGEPTIAEAYALLEQRIPAWRRPAEAVERLLHGQLPLVGAAARLLPGVEALGDHPIRRLNELGEAHVDQVRACVGARLVEADRERTQTHRPADERDNGFGAAQHSLDLVVGLASAVEDELHIPMPVRRLRKSYQKRTPKAFTGDEMLSWNAHLLRRHDPELDRLVLDVALASGARREALCSIRLDDLDPLNCRLQLRGKGKPPYWVPVRRSLLLRMQTLAATRGAVAPADCVLLRRPDPSGALRPITRRYFDRLWDVLGQAHPGDAPHTHRLRHTTAMQVHRQGGAELANRFLDHAPIGGLRTTYVYLDEHKMPDDVFLDRATQALGRFDDCPMPPPVAVPSLRSRSASSTLHHAHQPAPRHKGDEPPEGILAPV